MVRTELSMHCRWKKKTGLPYASLTKTAMHACGHDIHMATWVGSARPWSR